jgi:YHS domain-containing protein
MTTVPVCCTEVKPANAAIWVVYMGANYYFCSQACHRAFTADPDRYAPTEKPKGAYA